MGITTNATSERIAGQSPPSVESALLDVEQVAAMLRCSARHIYRLADAAQMPRPVKLGALVRWRRVEIEDWIFDGCPSCRKAVSR
ncbi:MAG: helix-turn-helix domain-containing protein [Planctomycetes bacterium]|nr:helix-turn-helix domain-containing protein [Planctomycetota bacterium]